MEARFRMAGADGDISRNSVCLINFMDYACIYTNFQMLCSFTWHGRQKVYASYILLKHFRDDGKEAEYIEEEI